MKGLKFSVLVLSVLTLSLVGCKSTKNIPVMQLNGKWMLKTFDGQDVTASFKGKIPTMELNITDKRISGNAGCNGYSGLFNLNGNQFSAPNLASTMMMCTEENKEGQFHQYMGNMSTISLNGEDLIFTQGGKQVMVFSKAKPLTVQDLNGTWTLQSIQGASANVHFKAIEPSIEFNVAENRVTGNAGCNRFNGPFMFSNGKLTIENVVTTRATCQDQQGENLFVRLLSDTHDVEVDGNLLILRKDGSETFRFVK